MAFSSSYQQNNGADDNNDDNNNNNGNNNNNNNGRDKNKQKKGKGRKKISMQRIENETNRQVTFSKRRGGIFKKSSELSTLCGADGAIVVYSPSEKAHSFGSPNVDSVATRFRNQAALGETRPNESHASQNNPIMRQRNQEITELERQLEQDKQRKKELNKMKSSYQPNIDGFTLEQLNEMMEFMLHFKHAFEAKVNDHNNGSNGSGGVGQLWDYKYNMHPAPSNDPFQMGSSSNTTNTEFFPGAETAAHHNHGFIEPLDPSGNNFGYPYPPNHYGYPNDHIVPDEENEDVPDDDEDASDETSTDEEDED